jgi:uncharacterized Zn-finger protein
VRLVSNVVGESSGTTLGVSLIDELSRQLMIRKSLLSSSNNTNTIVTLKPSQQNKPYSCELCNRTFNSKYNVVRHLKQYHAERRMFKCTVCGRDYKWIDSLYKHMKIHKQVVVVPPDNTKPDEVLLIDGDDDDEESNNNNLNS